MIRNYTLLLALAVFLPLTAWSSASAQARRVGAPHPQLTLGNSLTVSCSPSAISVQLAAGAVANASSSIAVTTTWSGISLVSNLNLYAYFASSSAALTSGAPVSYIPASAIFGQVPTGLPTSFTAFTQTGPFGAAGASLQLIATGSLLSLGGSRTDTLSLRINLTTLQQLPAATYTGTLYLQAQEF